MMYPFREGSILQFTNPLDGIVYDGVVWRVVSEDELIYLFLSVL